VDLSRRPARIDWVTHLCEIRQNNPALTNVGRRVRHHLVIEDNPDVRDLTQFILERLGARVTVAENGEEGFAKLLEDSIWCFAT
jgi:response regulator RpfG family c-di-GMP phosphodiesterase